jgi:serine/threonine protein kinase
MWSVACVLVELYTGSVLFEGSNEASVFYRIFKLLGQPPNYMLESGTKTGKFFRKSRRTFEIIEFSLIPVLLFSLFIFVFSSYYLD